MTETSAIESVGVVDVIVQEVGLEQIAVTTLTNVQAIRVIQPGSALIPQ